jgi:hypothetical protein
MFFDGNNGCNSTEFNVYTQMINMIPMALQNARFRAEDYFLLSSLRKLSFKSLRVALLTLIRKQPLPSIKALPLSLVILTKSCILM